MDNVKKERVLNILKSNRDGLTILEISKLLRCSRNTCAIILANLDGSGLVRVREIGKCKLHYFNGSKK